MYGYLLLWSTEKAEGDFQLSLHHEISTYYMNMTLFRHIIMSTYHYVDISLSRHIIISTYHYVDISLCRHIIVTIYISTYISCSQSHDWCFGGNLQSPGHVTYVILVLVYQLPVSRHVTYTGPCVTWHTLVLVYQLTVSRHVTYTGPCVSTSSLPVTWLTLVLVSRDLHWSLCINLRAT